MALTADRLRDTLTHVLDRVEREGSFRYRLIGTAAALLHGVPIEPGDVDLLAASRADVDLFARALRDCHCLTAPVWMPDARQYYVAFEVDGVKVEASTVEWPTDSEFMESLGSGPWTHFTDIVVGDKLVPTVALELRLATEVRRGRAEHAEAIRRWMER